MPRLSAPTVSKQLSRSVSSSAAAAARTTGNKNAGAILMPKYAELLGKSEQSDSSRGITTTHRPTPQPAITNRNRPLMQTFTRSASAAPKHGSNLDATVLPSWDALYSKPSQADTVPVVPILPDNYGAVNVVADAPASAPEVTIVAVDPERVSASSAYFEVTGLDGVDLKFAQEREPANVTQDETPSGGMLTDIWKGMVDDVLGRQQKLA